MALALRNHLNNSSKYSTQVYHSPPCQPGTCLDHYTMLARRTNNL